VAEARRLSAIMFTDVVNFTGRTQEDEAGTLRLLAEMEGLVRPLIAAHRGRAVKSTGDGLLVEFPSALEAARCAVAIQQRLHDHAAGPGDPAVELRIGIHLGDVEQRGEDILGDAVNIASRVQPLADVGGIAVSQQVFDQVRNKLALPLERFEPRSLKGLKFPMDVYRVVLPWDAARAAASPESGAPNRIAVLPFANISPDPKDAYFSDGLTEEIITVLSQLGELRVIARTSVEPYRTAPKSVAQVGHELGVAWVLEGSVRKTGNRLRITVQLIDARTQEHRWAKSYDHELDDVFELQAELARQVADTLKIKLLAPEEARLVRRTPPTSESYLAYLQGRGRLRGIEEEDLRLAQESFERAIALDDRNAAAYAALADTHGIRGALYRHLPRDEFRALARTLAARAVELDPDLAEAHTALAFRCYDEDLFPESEAEFRRGIALNPSYAWAHQWYGDLLADLGRPDEALREIRIAAELDPLSALVLSELVALLTWTRRLEEVPRLIERIRDLPSAGWLVWDVQAALALAEHDAPRYLACIEHLEQAMPGRAELIAARAVHDAMEGRFEDARKRIHEVEVLPEPVRPYTPIARTYAMIGDLDACFRWLNDSVDTHHFAPRVWRYEPIMAHVRADPRYARLLARLGLA
jgi:adenylate cyclase